MFTLISDMKFAAILILLFYSISANSQDSQVCLLQGIIESIGSPDINYRKEAVVIILSAKNFKKEEEYRCKILVDTLHSVRFDYNKLSLKVGDFVEYVWGRVEKNEDGPGGEMWAQWKKLN